ncbi:YdcF family protein [Butyrivibrio sp. CB08]|uniref:YdcF family protein n=1 Tax=Butyrivibrio sp. CB08 TaxID=2364879 RepID=UPI000EA86C79|nr:YdcF family protein [Butyrivibrio sp. CB08]RKM60362.1 YdcF family protein [Butyrivibrio sp. CB08]
MVKRLFTPGIRALWFVLAVLCLAYSLMVFLVGSGTFSFVIWLVGAAFFGACHFLAGKGRWAAVPKVVRWMTYVVLAAGAAVFLVCQVAIWSHFFDKGEADLDYVIVLGAQMRGDKPSVIYRYRLEKTGEYMEENPDTRCVTTGAKGGNETMSEGQGGADYLVSLGVDRDRIDVEELSTDTKENIQNALDIIRQREAQSDGDKDNLDNLDNLRIGIVTNGFHVFRGVRIARKLTDAEICGIAAYMQPQYIPNNTVRECFGVIRDFLAGLL